MGEGLATVFKTPWIWITIGVAALSNITYSGPMDVALPFLVKNELKADVSVLGLFASLSAIGALAGALLLGQFKKLRRRGWLLYGSWAAVGLAVAVIGLPVGVGGVLTMAFIIGACNSILGLVWVNLLQELVPTHLLGRISSIDYLGSYLFLPLGYSVGGWATEGLGAPLLFIIGGLLSCLLVGAGLLHPQIRKLD
jgi:MFS family permease